VFAQVGIGTISPDAKAQLDISSTTKGFLPPRMNESQRLAINPSTAGLMVYQTDGTAGLWYYSGSSWIYIINSNSATLPVANGGTGETTIAGVKSILGLSGANIAIGSEAGALTQTTNAIAIGSGAGRSSQGLSAISVGYVAGYESQGSNSIAIGSNTAQANQATQAVAIGYAAGQYSQGAKAVAIGSFAGNNGQTAGSIAINASGVSLDPTTAGLYINPIRSNAATNSYLNYDATTKEVTHSSGLAAGSVSTTTIIDGAVTDAKIGTVSGSKVTGDISGNAANVTGTISVANGGTGATTLTGVLIGNGANAVTAVAPGSSGNVLISNGVGWVSSTTLTVPPGAITAFAGSSAPTGYLLCDGSEISRATYANLFAVIGTTYGGGDGSLTFNLPDLRGRAIFGIDNMGGIAASRLTTAGGLSANNTLGASAGSQTITLQITNLPSHSHLYQDAYFAEGVSGGVNNFAGSGSTDTDNSFRWRTSTNGTSESIQNLNTGITGSGTAIQITPPLLVLNYIIKF
jgi:microcystin-dependent protein